MKQKIVRRVRQWGKQLLLNALIATNGVSKSVLPALTLRLLKIGFDGGMDQEGFITPYKYGYKAASVISIDFEHMRDKPGRGSLNHQGTLALLRTAEKYGIPLTWAICGEAAVKDYEAYEQILHSKVKRDIGIHTYSHRDLADLTCTELDVQDEITRCMKVLGDAPTPTTFIFPYNRGNHFDVIRENGFTAYRPMDRVLGYPRKRHGMWCIPPTYYLNDEPYAHSKMARRFIDFAIAYGCIFHLWLHPRSVAKKGSVEEYVDSVLEPIFRYMSDKSREGELWLCTIRELANYCEARENCSIAIYKRDGGVRLYASCQVSNPRFDAPPEVTLRIPISNRGATVQVGGITVPRREVLTSINGESVLLTLTFKKQVEWVDILS